MDDRETENQVRLRSSHSRQERLLGAGIGIALLLFSRGELAIVSFLLIAIGLVFIYKATFDADELWTIALDMVVVERKWPFSQQSVRFIRREDISKIRIDRDKTNQTCFRLTLQLTSGDRLTSPPLPEITHVRETTAEIAEQLGIVDIDPPANPLDATNAEIRLGEPVGPAIGRGTRIITLIIAGLCTIPYAYKFWNGLPLAIGEIIFLFVGPVVGFLFFRHAHTSAGSFWIVRQGELRVERLTRDGQPRVDTITGGDVDSISIERDSRAEEERYVVRVDRVGKQKFLSPGIGTQDETRAVAAEIALRLGVAPERVRQ
ncbi:hypothetical protein PMI42_05226 [Bradyrhizobium sp. YR681]|uniref:hypothetical protein n=1 Tax=Bradyrhizobium sp. YR681 TaxID=1144344 RepID=UPI000270DFD8|nr:hypothetical protein [Bradyrhizobium sp. YR681]EJN11456.1 hypothetical protein PMI42_05226 [Bradyrhizobium sp. YR681]